MCGSSDGRGIRAAVYRAASLRYRPGKLLRVEARRRVWLVTALALAGFAANSLLCRAALRTNAIDPASFTSVRLVAGAVTLAILAWLRSRGSVAPPVPPLGSRLVSALALFGYASAFSFAYVALDAGTGALLLFGSVQATMIGWAMARGLGPSRREWVGLAGAVSGLALLVLPSVSTPALLPAASMLVAGAAWGVYSLRGRGGKNPLGATAANFALAVPMALVVSGATYARAHVSTTGLALSVASGALASGVGYSLWYAALPSLGATRAGIVQLAVPCVAAIGGVLLFGEHPSARLVVATGAIVGSIAFATLRSTR